MQVKFSRPEDMPLIDSGQMRYGFWIDDGYMGIEAFTCGWGYYPLSDDTFECISYKDYENTLQYSYDNLTFQVFSDIVSIRHYDETWQLY